MIVLWHIHEKVIYRLKTGNDEGTSSITCCKKSITSFVTSFATSSITSITSITCLYFRIFWICYTGAKMCYSCLQLGLNGLNGLNANEPVNRVKDPLMAGGCPARLIWSADTSGGPNVWISTWNQQRQGNGSENHGKRQRWPANASKQQLQTNEIEWGYGHGTVHHFLGQTWLNLVKLGQASVSYICSLGIFLPWMEELHTLCFETTPQGIQGLPWNSKDSWSYIYIYT